MSVILHSLNKCTTVDKHAYNTHVHAHIHTYIHTYIHTQIFVEKCRPETTHHLATGMVSYVTR